jgi:hypothetical protein
VAFYGGSFTGLPAGRQEELLGAVRPFLDQGRVQTIRLSTRPDYIDRERLDLLVQHRVGIIELGAQSCDDRVLHRAGRGHDGAAIVAAAGLIKARGIRLGIQLMLGLPGDSSRTLRQTVQTAISLQPDFVRVYPVLVLRGSALESLYHQGGYQPLSLGRAVVLAASMKKRFDDQGIQVVRMGLQPTIELERALVAGPYHPAFGELVNSRLMLRRTRRALAQRARNGPGHPGDLRPGPVGLPGPPRRQYPTPAAAGDAGTLYPAHRPRPTAPDRDCPVVGAGSKPALGHARAGLEPAPTPRWFVFILQESLGAPYKCGGLQLTNLISSFFNHRTMLSINDLSLQYGSKHIFRRFCADPHRRPGGAGRGQRRRQVHPFENHVRRAGRRSRHRQPGLLVFRWPICPRR